MYERNLFKRASEPAITHGGQLQRNVLGERHGCLVRFRGQRCQHVRLHQLPYQDVHQLSSSDAELLHLSAVQRFQEQFRVQEAVGIIMLCLFAAGV